MSDPARTARMGQERCAIRADLNNLVAIVRCSDTDPDTTFWDICHHVAGVPRVRLVALLSQALLELAQWKDSR